MKKVAPSDLWQLRVLFGLGIVAIFVMLAIPTFFAVRMFRQAAQQEQRQGALLNSDLTTNSPSTGFLGEMGSACGGVKRLPCKPGLLCDAATDGISQGSCIKDPKAMKGEVPSQFGEACGSGLPSCGPGLFCRQDAQRNQLLFCSKLNESAPFIVSVKVEGMSPADGGYHAPAASSVTFHVQTTNVEKVLLMLKGSVLGEAKKSSGGKFDFTWTVPAGLDEAIEVVAYRGAEFSSVRLSLQADR